MTRINLFTFRLNVTPLSMLGRQFLRITRTASHGYFCQNSTSKFISELLTHNNFYHLTLTALLRTTSYTSVGYRIQDNLKDCYSLLNIKDGCSEEELKEAYIRLAKLYHPDSQTETADSKKFNQVKEAYKTIKVTSTHFFFYLCITLEKSCLQTFFILFLHKNIWCGVGGVGHLKCLSDALLMGRNSIVLEWKIGKKICFWLKKKTHTKKHIGCWEKIQQMRF